MATGGVPNDEQGEWLVYVRDDYRGPMFGEPFQSEDQPRRLVDGVGDGAFRLWIEGGQQVNIRDTNDVYMEMRDGQTYAVWVANRKRGTAPRERWGMTVEVDLHIDGHFLGSFLLDGMGALRIERPRDVAKKFTFFKPRGGGSYSNQELGRIRCVFKPPCREIFIRVKEQTREIFAPESYTVLDLKKRIDRLEHIAPDQQNLWLVYEVISLRLEDEKTLSSYGIEDKSVIECHSASSRPIDVHLPDVKIVLFMLFSDTVLDIKKRIHKKEPDLPPEKQNLFIHEKYTIELEDDFELLSHYMENGNDRMLLLCNPPYPKRRLYLKFSTGKVVSVEVHDHDTILEVKKRIQDKEGIPPNMVRLIYAGKQIEDDRTLLDYNIKHNCTLHAILRLGGGGYPVNMCGPDMHWTRGSTRLTGVSDQTFPKRVDDDAEYDASAGEELTIKLVGKDTYSHSKALDKWFGKLKM